MNGRLLLGLLLAVNGCDHVAGADLPQGLTVIESPLTDDVRSVFAVSDEEVYLAGANGLVARFDGESVTREQVAGISGTDTLWDVAASESGEVVVVGGTAQETPVL